MHSFCISANLWPVDLSTVFLGDGDGLNHTAVINCSRPYHRDHPYHYSYPHLYSWFYNGLLIKNHTNSSLTVTYSQDSVRGFGVYQCFSGMHPYSLHEITVTRVLLYGELHACMIIDDHYHICNLRNLSDMHILQLSVKYLQLSHVCKSKLKVRSKIWRHCL